MRVRRGHTLAELVVVLAVLGVMAAAAAPALGVWLAGEPTATDAATALLRDARSAALRAASPATLTLDPGTGDWLLEVEGAAASVGRLETAGGVLAADGSRLVVRFDPGGRADGGALRVTERGRTVVVRADRWTGEVRVDDA